MRLALSRDWIYSYNVLFYFSLGILILTLGASLYWRRFFGNNIKIYKYIFYSAVVLIFLLLFYQSCQQFQIWSEGEVSKFFLPPHQGISYFIFYVTVRFFVPYLISLAVALIFLFSAKILNRRYRKRFFYPPEPYFGGLAIFLMGHPGWLFYLVFLIFVYLLIHIRSLFIVHSPLFRISLYYLWLPVAIFVIIISKWLESLPLWSLLKI
jgi:hypothetical protein